MSEKRIITLSILGKNYTISTDEDEQAILRAASVVDSLLREIGKQLQSNNEGKIAILAALKLASDNGKLQAKEEAYRYSVNEAILLIDKELTSIF